MCIMKLKGLEQPKIKRMGDNRMIKKIGLQLYSIRDYMKTAEEMRASFRRLKDMGYDEAQTAGSGGVTYTELAEIAKETGIEIVGTHYSWDDMHNNFEQTLADHRAMGTTNCGIGGQFGLSSESATKNFIEAANKIADKLYDNGLKFTYHNHSHEFVKINDKDTIWDLLVEGLDPVKTSFVLDTCWVQQGGADVRHWIELLKGRVDILHLKDVGRRGGDKPLFFTEIGNGNLWWEGIIESAVNSGVKHYCVEQDGEWLYNDPFKSLEISSKFLHKFM